MNNKELAGLLRDWANGLEKPGVSLNRYEICTQMREAADELEKAERRAREPVPFGTIPSAHLAKNADTFDSGYHEGWNDCRREMRRLFDEAKPAPPAPAVTEGSTSVSVPILPVDPDLDAEVDRLVAQHKRELYTGSLPAVSVPDESPIALIAAERQRQIDAEGWTPEHDDEHNNGELAKAAGCYAMYGDELHPTPKEWPWNPAWWRATSYERSLVKAGALIVAELERLQRAPQPGES